MTQLEYCPYPEFLRSKEWLLTAQRIRERDCYKCVNCRAKGYIVHHTTYLFGRLPPDRYLVTLCEDCHQGVHNKSWKTLQNEYAKL